MAALIAAAWLAPLLLGCGGPPTDAERYERVLALAATDLDAAVAELDAIEDPLLVSAALMDLAARPDLHLPPDRAELLCRRSPTRAEARVCMTRFASTHLSTAR